MFDLKGKRILVTGAAGGLGCTLVETLLSSGADVCGFVRDASDAGRLRARFAAEVHLNVVIADLSDPERVATAVRDDVGERGPIYGLVNNAAIYPKARVISLDAAEMASVLGINAIAAAVLTKACVPGMKELGRGRILNIASNTVDTGMEELSAYVASKGALIGLARVWARELGPHGITANVVSPGAFRTDAEKIHADPEKYSASLIEKQAIKRRGEPREFADLVAFLLSDMAGFITGQTIRIDGGVVTR